MTRPPRQLIGHCDPRIIAFIMSGPCDDPSDRVGRYRGTRLLTNSLQRTKFDSGHHRKNSIPVGFYNPCRDIRTHKARSKVAGLRSPLHVAADCKGNCLGLNPRPGRSYCCFPHLATEDFCADTPLAPGNDGAALSWEHFKLDFASKQKRTMPRFDLNEKQRAKRSAII
ncbi:hypothetical protein AVEN_136357-1 [Araneus ventricosus]|uniref:Uncharacterized protein n=1 Tax=Araneus ventricosus TaxID=182803 RepID=A0A4Y2E2P5_ARAVE|nr:hypothetical protein AVEN_136357-1 [Araneus ventricosus]